MRYELLSTVSQINMGQSPPSSSYNLRGQGLPFFQGKADFGDLYPKVRVFCTDPLKVAEAGDILISVRAPVGPTNINLEKSCIGRGLAALRCRAGFETKYLLYFLRFYEPRLAQVSTGSTFGAISRDDLENIRIPILPPLEQKRITAILEKADRLRRKRRYALELSSTFLQSVFLEMFGDPATNPKGWNRVPISELGTVQTGNTPSRDVPENYGDYIEWIKSDNIVEGLLYITKSKEQLSELGARQGRIIEPMSLLITCIAGSPTTIGNVALTNRRVAFNQQINAITPNNEINPFFLYGMFLVAKPLIQHSTTLGMKRIITKSKMENLYLVKPPKGPQEKFATIVQCIERIHAQQREAERQAEHLFQTLLHQAFEGNIDLGVGIVKDEVVGDGDQPFVSSEPTGSYVQLQMNY